MSIIKLPKMNEKEIKELISNQFLCRIAFKGRNYPYIAPFQYVFINGSLYFHFTNYGKKMRLFGSDQKVCVEIEKFEADLSSYNFVIFRGELEIVENLNERSKVINKIVKDGKKKLSTNFLAAHGFKKEEGWDSLQTDKELVIVKLKEIKEMLGLKSP
jgi:nitroimidazol reductase NimA-like FMN-containing flavoprotein (pyridoxamine 5'-phosphate oxidase superfamily)